MPTLLLYFLFGLLFLATSLTFHILFYYIKKALLTFQKNLTKKDIDAIFSKRDKHFDAFTYTQKITERRVRIIDAIGRKGYHFIAGIAILCIGDFVIKNTVIANRAAMIFALLNVCLAQYLYSKNNLFSTMYYGPHARIMDGQEARLNKLMVNWAHCLEHPTILLIITFFFKENPLLVYMWLVYLPAIVGDAMGEIIGSTWGKQTIPVLGIGQVNRKSIAGTLGVFVFTLISVLIVSYSSGPAFIVLAIIISIVSTIVELISPRSSDSFTIPVINALICTAFHYLYFS